MKIRYLIGSLGAVLALAIAVPAMATTSTSRHVDKGAAAAHTKRHSKHARKADRSSLTPLSFTVPYPTAAERSELAQTGSVTLPISVGESAVVPLGADGKISVSGDVQAGGEMETGFAISPDGSSEEVQVPKNFERALEPASVVATQAGTAELTLTLTDTAKAKLAAGKHLQLFLIFNSPPAQAPALDMFIPLSAG
jgi:hypothetical protein